MRGGRGEGGERGEEEERSRHGEDSMFYFEPSKDMVTGCSVHWRWHRGRVRL